MSLYGKYLGVDADSEATMRNHHRGPPYMTLDGAGAMINSAYDFKGNPIEVRRLLARMYDNVPNWKGLDASLSVESRFREPPPNTRCTPPSRLVAKHSV